MLNSADLYNALDWTKFEVSLDVINSIFARLFDEFVIAPQKLICYWPSQNYADDRLVKSINIVGQHE